jgi:uncharacterized Fe-S cluster-containing MiaB family protein
MLYRQSFKFKMTYIMKNMAKQMLEKIMDNLRDLPPKEVQTLMRRLFKEGLYRPPKLGDITRKAEQITKENRLSPKVVDEAIKWARSQK